MKERLLKRISQWETATDASISGLDANELADSIRDDLRKLFNTRRGTVLIDTDYGMPDFGFLMNGYGAPDIEQVQQAIKEQTVKYEPRLTGINVNISEPSKKQTEILFILNAAFEHKNQSIPFVVNAFLKDDGSIALGV